ncbi:MAG: hydrogenase maturation protease [Anaerolineae bacterium]
MPEEVTVAALVIGYGNDLRGDDGIGPRVADAVAAWRRPGVAALPLVQLTPEIAAALASAERVVFVDADARPDAPGVALRPLAAAPDMAALTHGADPRALLALCQAVYERCPTAWLLTVPGRRFDLGTPLSPDAEAGVAEALTLLAAWLTDELS